LIPSPEKLPGKKVFFVELPPKPLRRDGSSVRPYAIEGA